MPESKNIELIDLVPPEWREADGKFHLMHSAYQCLFFSPNQHNLPYITGRAEDVLYLIIDLEVGLTYQDFTWEWSSRGNDAHFEANVQNIMTPKGVHILLYTPYKVGGNITEAEALSKLEAATGLINALEGKNASYKHRFSQTIIFPDGTTNGASPAELSPATHPHPFQSLQRVPEVAQKISSAEPTLKNRIHLALRWYDKSERENDFLDAFLKAWFALEILSMPDDTNVRPLVQMLAVIYGKTYEECVTHFQIGRIQGLRSNIIHNGAIVEIHYKLQQYIQAVFVDVLMHMVGHSPEKRADAVLSDTSVAHNIWRP